MMSEAAPDEPSRAAEVELLLRRAKAGDLAAFEQIMLLHERQVYQTALRLLQQVEDAQDAAQEVFLRFYRSLHRFDEMRACPPWLYRITVNVCHDINRRKQRTSMLSLDDPATRRAAGEPAVSSPDPHQQVSAAEEERLIRSALKRLPEKERAALVLRDLEGLSTKEVAKILGSSETTVRSQISTARVKLKTFRENWLKGAR